jgi:hypothetical protein
MDKVLNSKMQLLPLSFTITQSNAASYKIVYFGAYSICSAHVACYTFLFTGFSTYFLCYILVVAEMSEHIYPDICKLATTNMERSEYYKVSFLVCKNGYTNFLVIHSLP